MEKRAVISAEYTPPEHDDQRLPDEKQAQVSALDADFRKRLADAVVEKTKEA